MNRKFKKKIKNQIKSYGKNGKNGGGGGGITDKKIRKIGGENGVLVLKFVHGNGHGSTKKKGAGDSNFRKNLNIFKDRLQIG